MQPKDEKSSSTCWTCKRQNLVLFELGYPGVQAPERGQKRTNSRDWKAKWSSRQMARFLSRNMFLQPMRPLKRLEEQVSPVAALIIRDGSPARNVGTLEFFARRVEFHLYFRDQYCTTDRLRGLEQSLPTARSQRQNRWNTPLVDWPCPINS